MGFTTPSSCPLTQSMIGSWLRSMCGLQSSACRRLIFTCWELTGWLRCSPWQHCETSPSHTHSSRYGFWHAWDGFDLKWLTVKTPKIDLKRVIYIGLHMGWSGDFGYAENPVRHVNKKVYICFNEPLWTIMIPWADMLFTIFFPFVASHSPHSLHIPDQHLGEKSADFRGWCHHQSMQTTKNNTNKTIPTLGTISLWRDILCFALVVNMRLKLCKFLS